MTQGIQNEWRKHVPRRISLTGFGGVGKTELSISLVEKLGPIRNVLWLRASDMQLLRQDLITAALDLRNELLRFDSGKPASTGEDENAAFYFTPVPTETLTDILKRWLKAIPDDQSRLLVVLDDLDGLEPSLHEMCASLFSGNAFDLIYTTRDPSIADAGMFWQAHNFDVPPLQLGEAVDVFEADGSGQSESGAIKPSSTRQINGLECNDSRREQAMIIVDRLGTLPAAITMGSHYIRDNLGSKWNPYSYKRFLDSWDQDDGKAKILQSHRKLMKYRHSMFGSFQVSLDRLQRNVEDASPQDSSLRLSLVCLQLLSVMNLSEISQHDLYALANAIELALPALPEFVRLAFEPDYYKVTTPTRKPIDILLDQAVMELVKVSLIYVRPTDGTLFLNSLTRVCALLVPMVISREDKIAVEESAQQVWKIWKETDVGDSNGKSAAAEVGGTKALPEKLPEAKVGDAGKPLWELPSSSPGILEPSLE